MKTLVPTLILPALFGLCLAGLPPPVAASAQDADLCFLTAERVDDGETLSDAEQKQGHDACLRALAATASIVQKQQFQAAAAAISGTR